MPAVPEFILRKLYYPGSLKQQEGSFSFALNNTFASGTLLGFGLDVDRSPIPPVPLIDTSNQGIISAAACNIFPDFTYHILTLS